MLRVRIDGGQLSADQLRAIAGISTEFGRDVADVTDRQNVQLHWIRIEDVPAIWERLEAVGLGTTEACGDTPRVMLNCPLAGILEDEVIDATDVIAETVAKYVGSPEFSNLPRKWKTSMSGCVDHCTGPRDQRRLLRRRRERRRRGRLRPLGRRRPVHQPEARPADRRLRPARPGHRRLGGVHLGLPRLRLPPAAQPRADEVPDGRLGPGEVPPGAAGRVPARAPCPTARPPAPAEARPARPRRRHEAEGRRQRRRLRAAHRPDQRHAC